MQKCDRRDSADDGLYCGREFRVGSGLGDSHRRCGRTMKAPGSRSGGGAHGRFVTPGLHFIPNCLHVKPAARIVGSQL